MDIKLLRAMIAAGASDEEITAVAMTAVKQQETKQEPEQAPTQEPKQEPEQETVQNTNTAEDFMKLLNNRLDEIEQKIVNANIMRSDIPTNNENPVDILAQIINPPKRKEE